MGLEMKLTETSLFPSKIYYFTFIFFMTIGLDMILRVNPWGFFMLFWGVWAAGIGWNRQEEERADLMMAG
jgi:hypothetical protein